MTAIGIQQILMDVPEDEDGALGCKKVHNVKYDGDHHGYTTNCSSFLSEIRFAY